VTVDDGIPRANGGDAGRVVPVYAVTGGRTRGAGADLLMESLVAATDRAPAPGLQVEYRTILEMAEQPVSLAEIGAVLRIPVGVARVLVSDLAAADYLAVHEPAPMGDDGRPRAAVLERLLEGLRAR
jgi:uncharacterized protein DUF742